MKVLVFGSEGWIGAQFLKNTTHQVIVAKTRPENYKECLEEIQSVRPHTICSFIGRTHGPGFPTIDFLEQPGRLRENMRDNYIAPMHLAEICEKYGYYFVYLGTGCIYSYSDTKKVFTEEDEPNFFGSSYSIVKGYTNQELKRFRTTLQLRIRMPISKYVSPRNLIDKLVSYKNICSIPNSMTVLDDMWPIIDAMIENNVTGIYNLVNRGVTEHNWILGEYKRVVDQNHTWKSVSYEEQMKYITSHRSNNELDTAKLEALCAKYGLTLPHIEESVARCLKERSD